MVSLIFITSSIFLADFSPSSKVIHLCNLLIPPPDGAGGWNGSGCRVSEESTSNRTVCLCDHLTHFGILLVRQ